MKMIHKNEYKLTLLGIIIVATLGLLFTGCIAPDKSRSEKASTYDEICLRGVVYYKYSSGYKHGIAPAFKPDGSLILCESKK